VGSRWLHDLPQALAGIPEIGWYPGWETRSRSSGGFDNLYGIVCHHTATNPALSFDGYCRLAWQTHPERPVANINLGRGGEITVGVAGASNHAGKGGPRNTSKGMVPLDSGNRYLIGIEALNTGVGEPWGETMQDRYIALVQALCNHYGFVVASDIMSHHEWTPSRKIDPAGPSRFGSINRSGTWDMDIFRSTVAGAPAPRPDPPIPPTPTPTPPTEDWMASLPTIKKGDKGDYVERMQHLLAAAGYLNPANTANYDGVWGNGTESAKVKFDNEHGLKPSPPSDCGSKSWESLMTGKKW
jgi:hypothetical protein